MSFLGSCYTIDSTSKVRRSATVYSLSGYLLSVPLFAFSTPLYYSKTSNIKQPSLHVEETLVQYYSRHIVLQALVILADKG